VVLFCPGCWPGKNGTFPSGGPAVDQENTRCRRGALQRLSVANTVAGERGEERFFILHLVLESPIRHACESGLQLSDKSLSTTNCIAVPRQYMSCLQLSLQAFAAIEDQSTIHTSISYLTVEIGQKVVGGNHLLEEMQVIAVKIIIHVRGSVRQGIFSQLYLCFHLQGFQVSGVGETWRRDD
jgi:hypothetical protein